VAIHVDHYFIKNERDLEVARVEIPSLFEAGNTSISIDASYLPDDENLLAVLALSRFAPDWAGLETEVGEIKGDAGLSTPQEALFLIQGLNAHGVFPDWIALNNGSTHGIEASGKGIQLELTAEIHDALAPFEISGAQHGTSGNSSERLRRIARETRTTKANVATALQMISWGVQVNDDGNPVPGADGELCKRPGEGMTEELWVELVARAREAGLVPNDYKKLSRDFENRLLGQSAEVQNRMVEGVERFAYHLLTEVFNAAGTAPLAIEQLLRAGSYDLGPKTGRIEDPTEWTEVEIRRKAALIGTESRSSELSRRSV
jgi:fructose-bisphosphate aldolase class II